MNSPSFTARIIGPLLVFAVMVAILVPAHWTAIQSATWENGDMAANSILVQDAKSFHLLVGNYSRVGFNHPGPAILYVMAAGEAIFHDWLKIAPYPMGGQMLGVILYSAAWMALLWTLLRRMCGSPALAALLLGIFLAVTSLTEPRALVWLWPPDLYYFPFAAFTLALGELVAGKNKSLLALAVSWGFLLNGHVSFFGITAVMVPVAVAANLALFVFCRMPPVSLLSPEFLRGSRVRLIGAGAILALFLAPLAIETTIHWPGPIADYIAFSRSHPWNGPVSSVLFVAHYWGGFIGFLAGISLLAWLCRFEWEREGALPGLSLAAVIFAATIAILFYAVVGVDDVTADYIGIFYRSAPAFTAVLITLVLHHRFAANRPARMIAPGYAAAALLCLGLVYEAEVHVPGNDCHVELPELFAKMKTLGPMPLVFDFDNSSDDGNDWGHIWSTMAGVECYAKRQGVLPFVIRKNWQILFTKRARYSGPRIPEGDRFFVSGADRPGAALRFFGLSFYKLGSFSIAPGQSFSLESDKNVFNEYFLDAGWYFPDRTFVWSLGKVTHLLLPFRTQEARTIYLDLGAFLPDEDSTQHIEVTADGVPVGEATFHAENDPVKRIDRGKHYFNLPAGLHEPVDLRITIDRASSPHSMDFFSRDTRELGVSLYGLGVK
jgi:hypothetical protein